MKTFPGCVLFVVVLAATMLAYLSVWFTSVQPANHDVFSLNVYAWIIVAALVGEVLYFIYWLVK